jgi:hypothetical protein
MVFSTRQLMLSNNTNLVTVALEMMCGSTMSAPWGLLTAVGSKKQDTYEVLHIPQQRFCCLDTAGDD